MLSALAMLIILGLEIMIVVLVLLLEKNICEQQVDVPLAPSAGDKN